jgi:NodT family efflux transporter outer membrane factor (OMF) lipoprotein
LASLAAVRLSSQGTLAQDYFSLRALDNDQKILDDTVRDDKKALKLTQFRYKSGVAARLDVIQAQSQLETAMAAALNNGTLRAQYEHAIAVLVNIPPSNFKIVARPCPQRPPKVPLEVPSILLERRPDVAQAERLAAQANAQIGVAISAFYPVLTLSATGNVTNPGFAHWFSVPALSWALGSQLAETLVDGGLRSATVDAARANYEATVANYRLTVLTAFQNVEDSLAQLRILNSSSVVQDRAARDAERALKLVINEYKAGTVVYTDVITAQNTAYTAQQTASDVHGQQMTAAVGLIKALGGGWNVAVLNIITG